jgi:hypothetical protein
VTPDLLRARRQCEHAGGGGNNGGEPESVSDMHCVKSSLVPWRLMAFIPDE